MGQHLIVYASKTLNPDEVRVWCHARAFELIEVPNKEDQLIVNKVQQEMDKLYHTNDRFEHWSNWCGPMIWNFLVWDAFYCDPRLVYCAITAAATAIRTHSGLKKEYPHTDFTKDKVIEFLQQHIGYTVWGDNNGI